MSDKVTADNIRNALWEKYSAPEWYIGFEVGNSTGSHCRRHADAVAVNAYPSKGYETRGFEIKVSKADLKQELNNGIKSDEIARFCDYWFLVVPKGLTDGFTLPPTWGVLEFHDGVFDEKKRAEKLEKIPPTIGFLCAVLRSRERALYQSAVSITKEREEQIKRDATYGLGNAERQLKNLREKLDEIKSETGIALDDWTPTDKIINRLKAAISLDLIAGKIYWLQSYSKNLLEDAQKMQEAVNLIYAEEQKNDNA